MPIPPLLYEERLRGDHTRRDVGEICCCVLITSRGVVRNAGDDARDAGGAHVNDDDVARSQALGVSVCEQGPPDGLSQAQKIIVKGRSRSSCVASPSAGVRNAQAHGLDFVERRRPRGRGQE
jgi:hypothetical protein